MHRRCSFSSNEVIFLFQFALNLCMQMLLKLLRIFKVWLFWRVAYPPSKKRRKLSSWNSRIFSGSQVVVGELHEWGIKLREVWATSHAKMATTRKLFKSSIWSSSSLSSVPPPSQRTTDGMRNVCQDCIWNSNHPRGFFGRVVRDFCAPFPLPNNRAFPFLLKKTSFG